MVQFAYSVLLSLLPILGTFIVVKIGWAFWVHYVQQSFISGIIWSMLEIKPPREVERSPVAMELFFTNAMYHMSSKGLDEEYWLGAVWFWYSLEIVSIEGQVHFYIRTPSRIKDLIKTQMYAQYPQSEVLEADDYTLAIPEITTTSEWQLWGCEFKTGKSDAYPIRTYVDYKLDEDPKEEYKIDPISPVIELFSSLGKGEQYWMQIVMKPQNKMYSTPGTLFKKHDWVTQVEIELQTLLAPYTRYNPKPDGKSFTREMREPSWMKDSIKLMQAKRSKLAFECGIRICYAAKRDKFDLNHRRNSRLIFRQYSNPSLNNLNRCNSTQADAYAWSSLLMNDKKVAILRQRMLTEYRERSFFHLPMRHSILGHLPWPICPLIFLNYFHPHTFILNVEELATLFHFPGQILKVPGLERVESKEASPPPNLPS